MGLIVIIIFFFIFTVLVSTVTGTMKYNDNVLLMHFYLIDK